jgi:4-amino-4-deoxy-L-arabinose transferase-like glycosyltransferase
MSGNKQKEMASVSPRSSLQKTKKLESTDVSFVLKIIIISLLFLCAFGIRIYLINDPLMDFCPMRQYRSSLIARAYYFESQGSIPEWKKEIATRNKMNVYEPPIMEYLASISYRISGREILWIPRLLSSIFWLIGGLFLCLIIKKITSLSAAIFSTAFYLLVPFGILASRSFQPDPLMVMGLLISIFTILWYYEHQTIEWLLFAASISALAILIKFVSLFVIIGTFIFIGIFLQGFRKFVFNVRTFVFIIVSFVPAIIFYSYGLFISKSILRVAQGDILPHLLLKPFFWKGWFTQIGMVAGFGRYASISRIVGYTVFFVALLGIFAFRDKLSRGLITGLWSGYFLFGLVFSYTTHTHNYWHLQIIPLIAISLSPLFQLILNKLNKIIRQWYWQTFVLSIPIIVIVLGFPFLQSKWKQNSPDYKQKLLMAQEIGHIVDHNTKTLFLSEHYGVWLRYHGEIAGISWPTSWDVNARKMRGLHIPTAEEHFNALSSKSLPEFFVITFLSEFNRQKDLKEFLYREFPILVHKDNYLIFDLRKRRSDKKG